ncbi:MAG: helix-turn-helix transcriptional regulator [Treponema sp.]|nr:helix-turn-helix transcriptional regulator [Treponema sp.]
MPLQDVFIANVRKFRKQKKLTQEKLAELCDSDPHYIGQIENGRRFPSIQFIEKIAAALEQPPYLLFLDNAAETVPPPQFDATDKKALSVYLEEFNDSLHKIVSELNSRYLKKDGD